MDHIYDYKELYEKERGRANELESELTMVRAEQKTFYHELSMEHHYTNVKKKELTDISMQANEFAKAFQKIYKDMKGANAELRKAYYDTIHRLVLASEYKDQDTGKHISRISSYSALLAEKIGLSKSEKEDLFFASPMHDVGKIGIPDNITLKNGRLTDQEFAIIKTHTIIGAGILEDSNAKVLQVAQIIALSHHEKWDGSGYPAGISGENIPLLARIVAVADTFDALSSNRPYKSAYPIPVACDIIRKERARHFDPAITDIFLANVNEIVSIKCEIEELKEIPEIQEFTWSERDLKTMGII